MSNKKTPNLNQLASKTPQEILDYRNKAVARIEELKALKAKGGKAWTEELQEELDEATIFIVDVDEILENKAKETEVKSTFKVPAGTEHLVHAKVVSGRRFNPNTGKEESTPAIKTFTFGEWMLFEQNATSLGYTILEVLYNPYKK